MYSDGYKYWLAYKKGDGGYYRCCHYKRNCPGRLLMINGVVKELKPHDHPPDSDRVLVDNFRKVLTQRAASEKTDLHTIYWEEATQRHSDASMLYSFTQAEYCMRKARRKKPPTPAPDTLKELGNVILASNMFQIHSGNNKDPFYQTTINLEDTTCLIFFHKKTVDAAGRIEELHVDCSVMSAPQTPPSFYLMTGHAVQHQNSIPFFYAILNSKTYSGYASIFAFLREQFPTAMLPKTILTNFESLLQNALSITFPEATVKGCWFHYTDMIIDKMKSLGMSREISKGHSSSGLRMLLVLPLLPANYMAPGLQALRNWLREKNVFSTGFGSLCEYVEQTWLGMIGAEKISIFRLPHSIYNHVKNYNRRLMELVGIQNPMIWHMLECLAQSTTKQYAKITRRAKKPGTKAVHPKKEQLLQDSVIENATQLWIRTAVHLRNPLQFLQICSHCINDVLIIGSEEESKSSKKSLIEEPSTSSSSSQQKKPITEPDLLQKEPQAITLRPSSDPPPLAFFPKTVVMPEKQIIFSRTVPPPLIPFSPQASASLILTADNGNK